MSICRIQQYHHLIEGQVIFKFENKKWHIFNSILTTNVATFSNQQGPKVHWLLQSQMFLLQAMQVFDLLSFSL